MTRTHQQTERDKSLACAWFTAGRLADWKCPRCNATIRTVDAECPAPLAEPCPGFQAMERARAEFPTHWEGRTKE